MSLSNKTITKGFWKKISTAGQNGTVRFHKATGSIKPNIIIAHTDSVQTFPTGDNIPFASAVDLDINAAYLLPENSLSDGLFSDNGSDIYYATIMQTGETAEIVVDFG